jgi:hypothetical protein
VTFNSIDKDVRTNPTGAKKWDNEVRIELGISNIFISSG